MLLAEDTNVLHLNLPVVNLSVSNQNWFIVLWLMRCFYSRTQTFYSLNLPVVNLSVSNQNCFIVLWLMRYFYSRTQTFYIWVYTCCKSVSFKSKLIHRSLVDAMFLFEDTNVSHLNLPVVNLDLLDLSRPTPSLGCMMAFCFNMACHTYTFLSSVSLVALVRESTCLLLQSALMQSVHLLAVVNLSVSNQNWFIVFWLMRCFYSRTQTFHIWIYTCCKSVSFNQNFNISSLV